MDGFKDSIRNFANRPWHELEEKNQHARDLEFAIGVGTDWLSVSAELARNARELGVFDARHAAQDLQHHLLLQKLFREYYSFTQRLP
jgi:hypothetical protein